MSEPTPPPEQSEPATGPVLTPQAQGPQAPVGPPPLPPQPVHTERSNKLNKVAAWVGIVAGSVFIVVVIFGAGFLTGRQTGDWHRGGYDRGHEMMRPGTVMFPMGPPGGFQRGPEVPGPFGPGGPVIEIPRQPGGGPGGPSTTAPSRP